ncbi:MAG: RecQ family ATP-dependent DNA helicase [Chitinophagaceae bacterium]|nr:RecQ family ATP-dependent DNA helicase [Chitinophagaceae bacterium]
MNSPVDPRNVLSQYWGYPAFRPLQEEIIQSILRKEDTLALLPTGGGKSICYQVPALCMPGVCLVISPLIALMKDQVEQLRKRNITAFAIYSGMSRKDVINTLRTAGDSNCKFLYVSPERLETMLFKEALASLKINLIAVDEAHCISQWGYDFRPPYLRIAALRESLPALPVLALTASATTRVQDDIVSKLEFKKPTIFRQSFERPNLSYSIFNAASKPTRITEILKKVPGSSLVYCRSRKRTKEISDLLNMHGIVSDFYHAGLNQEERSKKQEAWINDGIRTMVCTNAFGMGIDKPDVRVVIHADVPECLENYYQEAGRAGRDGKKSYAVLLYQPQDVQELEKLPATRFPPMETIRSVYQSLMNFLQLPIGSGEGKYYDFDIYNFLKKFTLDITTAWAVLKTLEQEEKLNYNEQLFTPSTVQFTCHKNSLRDFETLHPELEPLILSLLRTYEGIFDYPARIQEYVLAGLLQSPIDTIKKELTILHSYGMIRYEPQKDKPQLFFPFNRVAAEELAINEQAYGNRKAEFQSRITNLLHYVLKERNCRSSAIAAYFGDGNVQSCGICDNCLTKARKEIGTEEFKKISVAIFDKLGTAKMKANDLIDQLPGISKTKTWQVIKFLQSENKLEAEGGKIFRV